MKIKKKSLKTISAVLALAMTAAWLPLGLLTAQAYETYSITVYGGIAQIDDKEVTVAIEGEVVTISCEKDILDDFDHWEINSGLFEIFDIYEDETEFMMPDMDVVITAVTKEEDEMYSVYTAPYCHAEDIGGDIVTQAEPGQTICVYYDGSADFKFWKKTPNGLETQPLEEYNGVSFTMPESNVRFYPVFDALSYSVSLYDYESDEGVFCGDVIASDVFLLPGCPFEMPSGCHFVGWETDGKTYDAGEYIPITQDTTFYAVWENGDSHEMFFINHGNGDQISLGYFSEGDTFILPETPFEAPYGEIFDQWYYDGKFYDVGEEITITDSEYIESWWKEPEEDEDSYEVWLVDTNGSVDILAGVFSEYEVYTLPDCPFEAPENELFAGWNYDSVILLPGEKIEITGELYIETSWKSNADYEVWLIDMKYNDKRSDGKYEEGDEYTFPYCPFSPELNINFEGWNYKGDIYQPGDKITIEGDSDIYIFVQWSTTEGFKVWLVDPISGIEDLDGTYAEDYLYTVPDCSFVVPLGKVFYAWDYNGYYKVFPDEELGITEETVLTAVWVDPEEIENIDLSVEFYNPLNEDEFTGKMVHFGKYITLPECDFTPPDGMEFGGWLEGERLYQANESVRVFDDRCFDAFWVDIETDTETDTETESDIEIITDTETDTEIETETDTDTEIETDTETDTETEIETDTETETETEIETDTETDTDTESETDTATDTETNTETDTEPTEKSFGDYTYKESDGKAIITDYNGTDATVAVPEQINGLPVTELDISSFDGNTTMKRAVLPDGLTTIRPYAFADCTSLKSILIPDSVTSIDKFAFDGCGDITIICNKDSYAEKYAKENNIPVSLLEADSDTDEPDKPTDSDTDTQTDTPDTPTDTDKSTDTDTDEPDKPIGSLGDIDGDGEITANDALLLLRASVGLSELTDEQFKLGDIDGDGELTANDALAVLRHSVGMGGDDRIGKPITG